MFRYFYELDGQTYLNLEGSIGEAIDAAMMDFSSGMAKPIKVQDHDYTNIFDFDDLHWMYSRTWGCEYDRTTKQVTKRDGA